MPWRSDATKPDLNSVDHDSWEYPLAFREIPPLNSTDLPNPQLIQIGDDADASDFLRELDDDLKAESGVRDIVAT